MTEGLIHFPPAYKSQDARDHLRPDPEGGLVCLRILSKPCHQTEKQRERESATAGTNYSQYGRIYGGKELPHVLCYCHERYVYGGVANLILLARYSNFSPWLRKIAMIAKVGAG